jgi:hypothetical protein
MNHIHIASSDYALVYMTDCTLATIESLATKKTRPVNEYKRQINIAQKGIDWIKEFNIHVDSEVRIKPIIEEFNSDVAKWAKQYEVI